MVVCLRPEGLGPDVNVTSCCKVTLNRRMFHLIEQVVLCLSGDWLLLSVPQSCPPAPPSQEAPAPHRLSCLSPPSRLLLNRRVLLLPCSDPRALPPLPALPQGGTASEVATHLTIWPRCLNSRMQSNPPPPPRTNPSKSYDWTRERERAVAGCTLNARAEWLES